MRDVVYVIVYFENGTKRLHRKAFRDQGFAQAFAIANRLDSWHLTQLDLMDDDED